MRKKRAILIGAIVAVIASVFWLSCEEPPPSYKGQSLSYWIQDYSYQALQNDPPTRQPELPPAHSEAETAIRSMGTNTIPFLLRWVRTKEPGYHRLLLPITRRLPSPLTPGWADSRYVPRPLAGARAFQALGSHAAVAVPELTRLSADSSNRKVANLCLVALAGIGSNGVPALLVAARDRSNPARQNAISLLGWVRELGPYTNSVVAELIAALKDPLVNQQAVPALGDLKARPEIVVPALASCLQDTNDIVRASAAWSLISFEEFAESALPELTNALADPRPEVREAVNLAINSIQISIGEAKMKQARRPLSPNR